MTKTVRRLMVGLERSDVADLVVLASLTNLSQAEIMRLAFRAYADRVLRSAQTTTVPMHGAVTGRFSLPVIETASGYAPLKP